MFWWNKAQRIAELETQVSLLEFRNTVLRNLLDEERARNNGYYREVRILNRSVSGKKRIKKLLREANDKLKKLGRTDSV